VVDARYPVGADKGQLAIVCWGQGAPTIVIDAGSGDAGIARWGSHRVTADLALHHEVCTYDRAGLGRSDQAPNRPRLLDDVVADLHALLAAAKVPGPYVLVGSSGGGFDIYQYAGRYPSQVSGLVLLDVPAGQATMSAEDVIELAWNNGGNPEHVDYVAVEHQMAVARLPIPRIPVTVVTATHGQSADNPGSQRVWLKGSSHPVEVTLDGGHDIYNDAPDEVVAEIEKVAALARAA
jgi:pimeloyl-ACP methyl ester carboxylesterase